MQNDNACVRAAVKIALALHKTSAPWILDNPVASWIWLFPEVQALYAHLGVALVTGDLCVHGSHWRRCTRFVCGNIVPR